MHAMLADRCYCLQFVSQETTYFLPSISVLEILPFNSLKTQMDQPVWLQGILEWRDVRIPIIDLSLNSIQNFEKNKLTRVIIFHSLFSESVHSMPYVGTVISEIPKSVTVSVGDFIFCHNPRVDTQNFVYPIKSRHQNAVIVDLQKLSNKIFSCIP